MQYTYDAENIQQLVIDHVHGNLEIRGWDQRTVTLEGSKLSPVQTSGDMVLHFARSSGNLKVYVPFSMKAFVHQVDGSCRVEAIREFTSALVKGNMHLKEISQRVELGRVNGNTHIQDIHDLHFERIAGNCNWHNVGGNIDGQKVNGNIDLFTGHGYIRIARVNGNAHLRDCHNGVQIAQVAGNLELKLVEILNTTTLDEQYLVRTFVAGNIKVHFPPMLNATLRAYTGHRIYVHQSNEHRDHFVSLVYGEGRMQVQLYAGGNIEIYAHETPYYQPSSQYWQDFVDQMASLGADLAQYWQEIGIDIAENITSSIRDHFEYDRRRYSRGRHTRERSQHTYTRRTWPPLDQERIDHLVQQAQQAASDGIQGAISAVEIALSNLRASAMQPPVPPAPPISPIPPVPPMSPFSPDPSPSSHEDQDNDDNKEKLDQERRAILQMVAEGRISPEEGEMLLEAL